MHASKVIRHLFALPRRKRILPPIPPAAVAAAAAAAGEIVFIGGPSGGGKSRLLTALRQQPRRGIRWIEPSQIPLGNGSVVDRMCDALDGDGTHHCRIELALELLSRVGLAEAWTYLQKPTELSDGQRWRLLLALAVAEALRSTDDLVVIVIDEFAALLDRVTARVVARALRRLIDRPGLPNLAAVIATSHDDLLTALSPDRVIIADFGDYSVNGVSSSPVESRQPAARTRAVNV